MPKGLCVVSAGLHELISTYNCQGRFGPEIELYSPFHFWVMSARSEENVSSLKFKGKFNEFHAGINAFIK